MEVSLFRALEVILRQYGQLPTRLLIDHFLKIKIVLRLTPALSSEIASHAHLSLAEQAIFKSKSREGLQRQLVCIVIDHPIKLPLSSLFFDVIEGCIAIGDHKHFNNILVKSNPDLQHFTRALVFKCGQKDFQSITQRLNAYLSVCQIFLGHLHLVVTCSEADPSTDILRYIYSSEEEDFTLFNEGAYFRALEERASRVTLEELSQDCQVERKSWGELLTIGEGGEGAMVWITQNRLPLLGATPAVKMTGKLNYSVFVQDSMGLKVFVRKELHKKKIEDIDLTIFVFNIRREYDEELSRQIEQVFESKKKEFVGRQHQEKEEGILEANLEFCQRIGQILELPAVALVKKLMKV